MCRNLPSSPKPQIFQQIERFFLDKIGVIINIAIFFMAIFAAGLVFYFSDYFYVPKDVASVISWGQRSIKSGTALKKECSFDKNIFSDHPELEKLYSQAYTEGLFARENISENGTEHQASNNSYRYFPKNFKSCFSNAKIKSLDYPDRGMAVAVYRCDDGVFFEEFKIASGSTLWNGQECDYLVGLVKWNLPVGKYIKTIEP